MLEMGALRSIGKAARICLLFMFIIISMQNITRELKAVLSSAVAGKLEIGAKASRQEANLEE